MKYKNSEGYADLTASIAIRNASKNKRKWQRRSTRLTFMIGELSSFGEWLRRWDGAKHRQINH
ncbi:hypothetical protein C808_01545 [Lachnospiraceae bacterium M18-1]|nr:hypothetical protein C808_01545 [Lachnospiraceae bacterium M18-1]